MVSDKSGPEKAFVNTVDRVLKLVLLLLSFPLFTTIIKVSSCFLSLYFMDKSYLLTFEWEVSSATNQ